MKLIITSFILIMIIGCGGGEVKDLSFDLGIQHGKLDDKQKLEANKGDRITLNIKSDSSYVLHLHGYDLEVELQKGNNNKVLSFEANATGKFDMALHSVDDEHSHDGQGDGGENIIGSLKVYP